MQPAEGPASAAALDAQAGAGLTAGMDSASDQAALLAALDWQLAMGADEAVAEAPVNRFALPASLRPATPAPASLRQATPAPADRAQDAAPVIAAAPDGRAAGRGYDRPQALSAPPASAPGPDPADLPDLAALAEALAQVPTPLRDGARRFVFADGNPAARVMIVGEAPGREEDIEGLPFVGPAGQLLDRMLAAIGLSRSAPDPGAAVYITNVLPWRPPNNREPEGAEIALFLPWLHRHIALADPDILVLMGNTPCKALLGRGMITRIRGQWAEVLGKPALPMFHPAYLLRQPAEKRAVWADLLALKARLLS